MSIILLNLLVGPPMFRHALIRVGEAKMPAGGKAVTAATLLGLGGQGAAIKENASGGSLQTEGGDHRAHGKDTERGEGSWDA